MPLEHLHLQVQLQVEAAQVLLWLRQHSNYVQAVAAHSAHPQAQAPDLDEQMDLKSAQQHRGASKLWDFGRVRDCLSSETSVLGASYCMLPVEVVQPMGTEKKGLGLPAVASDVQGWTRSADRKSGHPLAARLLH